MQAEAETQSTPAGRQFDPNTVVNTLLIALVLCLVCSLVVSASAVMLRSRQEANRQNKMKRNVLIAAGLWKPGSTDKDIPELFGPIQLILVNLPGRTPEAPAAGTLVEGEDPEKFDQKKAAKDPARSVSIPPELDLAGIKRREKISKVYLVRDSAGKIETIVLPIYGKGLWSTLYGYLALNADGRTAGGITFYEHAETPGLGGEVDNPKWKATWSGAELIGESGEPVLDVTKPGYADAANEIDGLSGATITSGGVERTVRYWLGDDGFGPFLKRYREGKLELK